ncbi:telomerase reverse transcriptase isoform X2 [Brachyhypopomus gauderio]|uniref:telomerase reverse transcriptase isoform X2 n=1 Tax=Brachyhypopomus gauderio TaxID=698409 RepID=UPI0040429183
MSECNLTRVLGILGSLYPHVQTLEEFSESIVFTNGQKPVLVEESDTSRFRSLVRGVVVCTDSPLRRSPSGVQLGTLPEVLAFVLNHMKRKKRRNILRFGYHYHDGQGDSDPFKFHGAVSQSAAFICGSELWRKINQRLGTDVTKFLLQDCTVFAAAPPTCLVQVCGVPVYDLVPVRTWSGFFLTASTPHTCNITQGIMARAPPRKHVRAPPRKHVRAPPRTVGERNPKHAENAKKRKRGNLEEDKDLGQAKKRCVGVVEHHRYCPEDIEITTVGVEYTGLVHSEREESASTVPTPREGYFSWKPSDQPCPRPSYCSVRVLSMLYGGRGMKAFLLNRKLCLGVGGAQRLQGADLVRRIFLQGKACLSGAEGKPARLPQRFFTMVPLFNRLLRQHRKCPYAYFLRQKCSGGEGQEEMASLLASHCSSYRVYLFVRECLRQVVPHELWGSHGNMLHFLSCVKLFLRMGKFERLSLARIMWRMRVSDCLWLGHKKRHCPSEQRYREWILGQFLLWLLHGVVLGLVRSMFYVTESSGHKHALRFYRRDVWAKLQERAFREHLFKGQWEELTPQQVASLPKTTVISRIRFIPKATSMRPITRLSGSGVAMQFQSSVRDLQNVLGVCVREQPSLLGSTVWGRQDIHRVLSSVSSQHTPQPLYFVKVDITGAYDSLPHPKLLEVVQRVLGPVRDESFSLRHYAKVWTDSTHSLRRRFCTKADACEPLNMKGFVLEEQDSGKLHSAILVEKYTLEVRAADVMQFFEHMLNSYVIQYNQKWYRQVCGVPQGSAVSTMLCNLCYGHMENSLLKDITDRGGCLMRLVDDFLLITPKLSKAVHFLKTLLAGVPDYGCEINPQKVAVNFPVCEDLPFPDVTQLPPHCLFPWCGLLIDTRTLDVYNDYSGYAGLSLRYSLTLGSAHSAAVFMRQKLLMILRLKCDHIFLDLRLNSVEAVYKNVYKLLVLQALRFHVCVRSLPLGQSVNTNPSFFLHMIWSMAKNTHRSYTLSNTGTTHTAEDVNDEVLQYEGVELLCCFAFQVVLSRHRPAYHCLLPRLHRWRRHLLSVLRGIRLGRVLQAATPAFPLDFRTIRT